MSDDVRLVIGIEQDARYYQIAQERAAQVAAQVAARRDGDLIPTFATIAGPLFNSPSGTPQPPSPPRAAAGITVPSPMSDERAACFDPAPSGSGDQFVPPRGITQRKDDHDE